jgi:hypothetical protein
MVRSESDLKSDLSVTGHGRDPDESGQAAREKKVSGTFSLEERMDRMGSWAG